MKIACSALAAACVVLSASSCWPSGVQTATHGRITGKENKPGCWQLDLKNGDTPGHVCVSQKDWKSAKVGGYW